MFSFTLNNIRIVFYAAIIVFGMAFSFDPVSSRAVNISNTWILPEEGFPVFYRYFRDRISWYEADAVCQFHHANLVTVDTTAQYDATRAYLKELDIVNNVWIGLIKSKPDGDFTWTERREYRPLSHDGFWDEQISQSTTPICVSTDPAADFRWHGHHCGGPEVASFICELPVPSWASQPNGCMLTSLPSLTVLYLPEQAAVELTSDCGLGGTKSIVCKGQADRDEMIKQLSCGISPEDFDDKNVSRLAPLNSSPITSQITIDSDSISTSAISTSNGIDVTTHKSIDATKNWLWSSNTVDVEGYDAPTRHRRETDHTDLPATLSTLYASTLISSTSTMTAVTPSNNIEAIEPVQNINEGKMLLPSSNIEVHESDIMMDTPSKILVRNENFDDVETFNPRVGPELSKPFEEFIQSDTINIDDNVKNSLDEKDIDKHDNFFAAAEMPIELSTIENLSPASDNTIRISTTTHNPITTEDLMTRAAIVVTSTTDETTNEPQIKYANAEPDFMSINQGQLFGGENGTHFDIETEPSNDTTEITISLTTPSENHPVKSVPPSNKEVLQPTDKSQQHPTAPPSMTQPRDTLNTTNVVDSQQYVQTTTQKDTSDSIKLLELDTDFVATRKQENNNSKFIEIDDSFTIGGDPHEHKIIEINIIDRKTKNSLPSKLIITTKVNNKSKIPPKPLFSNQKFTSSVKKDGKNIKPPTVMQQINKSTLNETTHDIINVTNIVTTSPDLFAIDSKINSLNNISPVFNNESETIPSTTQAASKTDIVIPERIKEQEIEVQKQQEENFRREFQSMNPIKINDQFINEASIEDGSAQNNDELNSDIPPTHKHRGRLLPRSPHRSNYYPYFFSRVLG
ncbi:uncharacterized protein LOC123305130 [Chrysoperla carnea]|uniref:uncharacterized protein LOC123305130 n=1 Tax=Chrysoperla carnea TaxID=189513 RepID=UPI001D077AD9|nr:uncharacterized protein LOC123305130 [Chrysoperla carnea]